MIDVSMLNENQKEAVLSDDKYIRIIAGAGSGKTRVLTMRIVHLIEDEGVFPSKIVAITFTNKAANEMKNRIRKMLPDQSGACWISTIHSLCVRILREDILSVGFPRNFTVLDANDQKAILKEAYKELAVEKTTFPYGGMLDYISNNKSAKITCERAKELAGKMSGEQTKAKVYEYYCKRQNELYALDFDDLLLVTVDMFKRFPEVLNKWNKRFSYVHVDEFQDIDKIQYELITQLTGTNNSLYVVGDPDQTIYTWRGADVNIIMNFEKDFAPCKTIVLNENYRSTKTILDGANSVIQNNKHRLEKDLYTQRIDDSKITHYASAGDEYEAAWIANKISDLHKAGNPYKNYAVLYRSNYLSRAIEHGLINEHIPYVIFGGVKFYERAEIKDILSYLRLIVTGDDLAFTRVLNVPRRGLGDKTIDTIAQKAREINCSMFEACQQEKFLPAKSQKVVDGFVSMIEKWRENAKQGRETFTIMEDILEDTGYRKMLEDDNETERVENIKELINDVKEFTVTYPDSTIDEYLQLVSLYGDKDETNDNDYVQLMTVHAAKGLEFDTVFVTGMSDGIFPNERAMNDGLKGVEEERRLAYVAFTRARNKLYLCESSGFSYVLSRNRTHSRFIDEIDENNIEHIGANFEYGKPKDVQLNNSLFTQDEPFEDRIEKAPTVKIKKGDLVEHSKFGDGVVIKIEGGIAQIAFKYPYGVKKIAAGHPSIKKKAQA